MKYIKYGQGKWVPEGWQVNFSTKGSNNVVALIEKAVKKLYQIQLRKTVLFNETIKFGHLLAKCSKKLHQV